MSVKTIRAVHLLLAIVVAWLGAICVLSPRASAVDDATDLVDFNRDVRPILSDKCFFCHGPDGEQLQAGLRLDDRTIATSKLDSGAIAIVPGDPNESELVYRIESFDEDERMPPLEAKLPPLTAAEKRLIRRWIEQGAHWEDQWSLVPLGEVSVPRVEDKTWPRNPIDRFVLARLEAERLGPSPEARMETLPRRVSFDLTGLPPTPEEVLAFLDDTSPDAYEQVVDQLLASPRYGEHMTVHWLDLARYSDTFGYQVDRDRRVCPWRDCVIRALNKNLSYLGLTLQCARCHDHKYDAVTQKEFYQLSAFFDNIDESGLSSYFTQSTPTPTLQLADDEQKQRIADLESLGFMMGKACSNFWRSQLEI